MERKDLINDNLDMPNLCRRGRKSPQNSFHATMSSLLNTTSPAASPPQQPPKAANLSDISRLGQLSTINLAEDESTSERRRPSAPNLLGSFRRFFGRHDEHTTSTITAALAAMPTASTSTTTTTTTTTLKTSTTVSSGADINIRPFGRNGKLERNLRHDFDEEPRRAVMTGAGGVGDVGGQDIRVTRSMSRTAATTHSGDSGDGVGVGNGKISTQYVAATTYMSLGEHKQVEDKSGEANLRREEKRWVNQVDFGHVVSCV